MKDKPKRVAAIGEELDRAADEYIQAKNGFDAARVRFEVAREKFSSIKRLAAAMLPSWELYEWQSGHPGVQYVGLPIGVAILSALESRAYERATGCLQKKGIVYHPWMGVDLIIHQLESGGFDFRTTTPAREVNAALIRLEGVQKDEESGLYAVANANEILERMRKLYEGEELPFE